MGTPDQDTGLALGVWPQLGIVWPELALERFCRPRETETDMGLGQVGGCTLCPSLVFNASKYSNHCLFIGMSRKQATMSFPICCQAKVFQAGISNGAEEAVGKSCRLAAEPSHFLTHLHIKAHSSSTNEQLAQLSRRGGSVDVLIGWICVACCASRQPGFLQPGHRSRVPPAHHNPSWTILM